MKRILSGWITVFIICSSWGLQAQRPLPEVEVQLAQLAQEVLNHNSLEHKIAQNKKFASLLNQTLERPESFDYPFDSLKTISILHPRDNSFRLFTWYIVDQKEGEYYGQQYHYHFGVVQRKYEANGKTEYIPIPLFEMQEVPHGVENLLLDNNNWLGALYYLPKNHSVIPSYELKYSTPDKKSNGKVIKVKQPFYVLMGWSGNDERSNLKMVEVMSFDPKQKDRVIFGADVFYFDLIPKFRAVFQYSEYAPFSLNFNYVQLPMGRKKEMIIYDHMGTPKAGEQKLKEIWEMGPDGSYDALSFYKRGGYFEWYRNVELAEKYISRQYQKKQNEIRSNQENILSNREKAASEDPNVQAMMGLEKGRKNSNSMQAGRKSEKQMLKEMEARQKEEAKRLKAAGIDTSGN